MLVLLLLLLLLLLFSSLKAQAAMWFTAENEPGAWHEKFHLSYNILLPRRADTCNSLPSARKSVRTDGVRWRHNQIFSVW